MTARQGSSRKLEEAAVSRVSVRAGVTAHGSEFDNSGRHLTTLYDGSVDIDGRNNTAVLDASFKEF